MDQFEMLNQDTHRDLRIITERASQYGDNVMFSLVFPFEFRSVQACYPILFHRDPKGEIYPVALFGFESGENLFLTPDGWKARYLPAMVRREPFLIGMQATGASAGSDPRRVMSLNMSHPRVSRSQGEPLFDQFGARTRYLEDMATLLETLFQGAEVNKRFMATLQQLQLIESVTFDIALADGSRNQLLGFFAIDEEKVRHLTGDQLGQLSQEGFLMPLFMALASTVNIRTLIDLKNERIGSAA